MKTLKLISKSGSQNYFFGEINAIGQKEIAIFNNSNEMNKYFSERDQYGFYRNSTFCKKIISAEYRISRTYTNRSSFDNISYCEKIFNKLAK